MSRTRFDQMNCSVARALDVLGDWWTLLIIRECMMGTRRFVDFQRELGLARNVLSERLRRLVEQGVLEKVDAGEYGERFEYRLTEKGRDLHVVLTALREWSDRWVYGPGQEPVLACERGSARPVPPLQVRAEDGRVLGPRDLELRPGPGADEATRARFAVRRARRSGS